MSNQYYRLQPPPSYCRYNGSWDCTKEKTHSLLKFKYNYTYLRRTKHVVGRDGYIDPAHPARELEAALRSYEYSKAVSCFNPFVEVDFFQLKIACDFGSEKDKCVLVYCENTKTWYVELRCSSGVTSNYISDYIPIEGYATSEMMEGIISFLQQWDCEWNTLAEECHLSSSHKKMSQAPWKRLCINSYNKDDLSLLLTSNDPIERTMGKALAEQE